MGTLTVLPGGGTPPTGPTVHDDVVALLERVLAKAQAGEVTNIAMAWNPPESGACSCYSTGDGGLYLLSAVTILQARMIQEIRS
jgi:hypothetical protein